MRAQASWNWKRARRSPPEKNDTEWALRREEHRKTLQDGPQLWRYLEMVRLHAIDNINWFKAIPCFGLPMAVGARRLVELGSSFSYYPATYDPPSPWGRSSAGDEGVISTRLMLTACKLMSEFGPHSSLTSVDIRESSLYENVRSLLTDMDLIEFWDPQMGTDSIEWLQKEKERVQSRAAEAFDFVLVDSTHTYDQVARELACVLPLMSPTGIILVDDCWITNYKHGASWIPEESDKGLAHGGEYGAVIEFLENHPEWKADWIPQGMVVFSRPQ